MNTEQIIKILGPDEPEYSSIVGQLNEEDYAMLKKLIKNEDITIAAKAIICLGWNGSKKSLGAIKYAAKSENPVLRLTAAQALSRIKEVNKNNKAINLISELLDDKDVGVKKFALKTIAVSKISSLKGKVKQLSINDPKEFIRSLAQKVSDKLELADNNPIH